MSAVEPRISLTTFADYVTRSGSAKKQCVMAVHRRLASPNGGWSRYGSLEAAIKRDLLRRSGTSEVDRAVARADARVQRDYLECADGWRGFRANMVYDEVVDVGEYRWKSNGLIVKATAHFGLLNAAQLATTVVRLWCRQQRPDDDSLNVMLHLLPRCESEAGEPTLGAAEASAMVIDLRRGVAPVPDRATDAGLEQRLHEEAAKFMAVWRELVGVRDG